MEDMKSCSTAKNCWPFRFEIVGIILLILATILTLITLNGFGIAAMFIVGAALCCHRCYIDWDCHDYYEEDELELTPTPKVVKTPAKKTKVVNKL